MAIDNDIIKECYKKLKKQVLKAKKINDKPFTLAEKILYGHLIEFDDKLPQRGKDYVNLKPDRVAMQDATAQMALLQFINAGMKQTCVPASVHCDHLIQGELGASEDLKKAKGINTEVYEFLSSVSKKFGIGFWAPGSGIIHQIIFENYAFPGGLIIGTDSHTPNAGGLSMAGVGVGGADAVDVMVGMPWELKWPKIIGVHLKGKLSGWTSPKDVILKLAGMLTVKGGTGAILEYFGEGVNTISASGRATITNMGAEVGATTSLFPFDKNSYKYLISTGRKDVAQLAKKHSEFLQADKEVLSNPVKYFDEIIEINLDELEPHIVGPFTPDLDRPVSKFKEEIKNKNYPEELKVGLIGSCTNSSFEDLSRVASIIKDAKKKGLKLKSVFYVSPGSTQIYDTLKKDGILKELEDFGAIILSNSCGPCIGQWKRNDFTEKQPNSIITSFNRNFKARNDGNEFTLAFISSPEIVTAMAISGKITFNPLTDSLINEKGKSVKLKSPFGEALPKKGFSFDDSLIPCTTSQSDITINISKDSDRLQFLTPFEKWDEKDMIEKCRILLKISGKCTTDHISPAGKWLTYRGHLDNISENMYEGAVNAFTGEAGKGFNQITKETNVKFPEIARYYKSQNNKWIVIGDENYGEGSSREHAAMEPRHLGCAAIITKSFARIAETNLKKQGILVATFANPDDYNKINKEDICTISGLKEFKPGSKLVMKVIHEKGEPEEIFLNHTYSSSQIKWFKCGSSLNHINELQTKNRK